MTLKTELHERHLALGARMMEFSGWSMPLQYTSVVSEHNAVRTGVGVFDTSHMPCLSVVGKEGSKILSRILTMDLDALDIQACSYGFMLNEDAGIRDDLILYHMDVDDWMLVVNAGTGAADLAWLRQHSAGSDALICERSKVTGKLDLQGPKSERLLRKVYNVDMSALRRFRFDCFMLGSTPCMISRTGYTGEDGFELYIAQSSLSEVWDTLVSAGATPCGLGARDTLRLEAGLPLYGHEFDLSVSPAEAGMMRFCKKERGFIGQEALKRRASEVRTRLTPFLMEGRQSARHGNTVRSLDGREIGRVTSGSFAPTVSRALGFAYVEDPYTAPDTPWLINNGRSLLPARATRLPFLARHTN